MTTVRIYNNFLEIIEYTIPTNNKDVALEKATRKFYYYAGKNEKITKIVVVS